MVSISKEKVVLVKNLLEILENENLHVVSIRIDFSVCIIEKNFNENKDVPLGENEISNVD